MPGEIAHNLQVVQQRIVQAATRVGRSADEITLVAVTKTVPVERIVEAIAAGVRHIGENYVQEAREKQAQISSPVTWHLIGHLQTNKAGQAVSLFHMIHTVDSVRLAQALSRRAQGLGRPVDVLVEVNLSGEASKFGVSPDEAPALVQAIRTLPSLRVRGLMGMAPLVADPEEARPYFRRLRRILESLPPECREHLSMGMSNDFEVAIEEGATLVRIGTAIFGARTPHLSAPS